MSRTDYDVAIIGAGIVGLAHALSAADRGLNVVVFEAADAVLGASVRNFGHACVTAQTGDALVRARASRDVWMRLAQPVESGGAGLWAQAAGTLVVARHADEMAVLEAFQPLREPGEVRLLRPAEVSELGGFGNGQIVGGAVLPLDLRVNPRAAAPTLARWLERVRGVEFRYGTTVQSVEPTRVITADGPIGASAVLVCVNHEIGRFFPAVASAGAVESCTLQMLRVSCAKIGVVGPAVLSGYSMLRYGGFVDAGCTGPVRERLERERPEALEAGLNLMLTQLPEGDLIIGDTHRYDPSPHPFSSAEWDRLVVDETARLLGVRTEDLVVRQRWLGCYASSPTSYLVEQPLPGVHVVSVTTGIGMTTAFGLAEEIVAAL